jgi:hypothetical protein
MWPPSSASCGACGLHWDFNLRPSLKGAGGGVGNGKSLPVGSNPAGAAAARAPWVKQPWTGTKACKTVSGSEGTGPVDLEKACGILSELLGEEHPEVRSRREQLAVLAAGSPPAKSTLIRTCDELAAILGEEHPEVASRRKVISDMPEDEASSLPAQKQLQNVLRQLDGLHKKHIVQSAKLASLEEQKAKLQTEIDDSKGYVAATQGRIDDAEQLKTSILAKCSRNEGLMEIDGGTDDDTTGAYAFEDMFTGDVDLDPDHRDMFDKFVHLKDTLSKLAKAKHDEQIGRDNAAGEVSPDPKPTVVGVVGPHTKFGMSMCAVDPGNSEAWPNISKSKTSASSYGKAPVITHQRGMPFKGLAV